MLQLKKITKNYIVGDQVINALAGIDVEFRKSEFVSVLGPSGCGKTTLMNIVGGLDKYTSGDLVINGKSTKSFSDREWDDYRNKKVGFIFQNYNLIPHLSVLGNVELALTISGISKEERRKRALDALNEVGLSDRLRQRPSQLSGGQMQRVAIARALVNRPEILLADEPTGALDTETSEQIMALIKKIAADRLVVMVTHNPELAQKYSTRMIKMVDGYITEDSKPFSAGGQADENADDSGRTGVERSKKSSMSFATALSLSGRNLTTKKGRTVLTSIAGSIGIIGIALILAISNGMNGFISKLQSDMLSSTPITISTSSVDPTQAMRALGQQEQLAEFPKVQKVYVEKAVQMTDIMSKNNITQQYIDYIKENLEPSWYNDIMFKTGLDVNLYGIRAGQTDYSELNTASPQGGGMNGFMGGSGSAWQLLPKDDFVQSQYDVLFDGNYPANKNELALIISSTNQVSESTLVALGLRSIGDTATEYNFSELIGKEYKVVKNDLLYENSGSGFQKRLIPDIAFSAAETVKITCILRIKPDAASGALSSGIGYTQSLYDFIQSENKDSEIIAFMDANPSLDPIKGTAYVPVQIGDTAEELREADYRALGGELLANEISIYSVSYETKSLIKETLDKYNEGKAEKDIITYADMAELLGDSITSIVNVVTYVLIAFTGISLVVSGIMIAIITYVSVLERTKEIGILRSIGARKKDVTRVFNAETFIIGLIAGLIGVGATYLLSIPINIIVNALAGVSRIANLSILYAVLMVAISVTLTVVSGLIPAKKAAKRDPVTALRTE